MSLIIGLDFDGTVVTHDYPRLGDPVPGAIEWLLRWQAAEARIILWTMRSGETLDAAVGYLENAGVRLWGVNQNPEQASWTSSRKQYAHCYIDDAAYGCPLVQTAGRPYADWSIIGPAILELCHERYPDAKQTPHRRDAAGDLG